MNIYSITPFTTNTSFKRLEQIERLDQIESKNFYTITVMDQPRRVNGKIIPATIKIKRSDLDKIQSDLDKIIKILKNKCSTEDLIKKL